MNIAQFVKTYTVRYHISWRGERNIFYKSVETSPLWTRFKILGEARKRKPSGVPSRTLGPNGVDCEIPHRLERRMKHRLGL